MSTPKKNYTYIGTSTNQADKVFDRVKYDQMIADNDYQSAYDYAMNFRLNDPIEEAERVNHLKNMLREGHVTQAVYENVDEANIPTIAFRNAVQIPGGLERLSMDNEYANQFKDYKNSLGGGANRIRVSFDPQVQKRFGIDWLGKDNNNANIDVFYEKSGFNKQYLEANSVNVRLVNGRTYLEFDKSNDLANTILLNLPYDKNYSPWIIGIDENGNPIDGGEDYLVSRGGGDAGLGSFTTTNGMSTVMNMQNLYNSAQKIENKAYTEATSSVKQYSSMFVPLIYDNAQMLEEQLAAGQIKDSNFNSRIKRENNKLIDKIAGIGVGQYNIATAYFNKNGEAVNRFVNQEQQKEIIERYRGTNSSNIKYGISISGNKVGLTVILPPIQKTNNNPEKESMSFTIFGDDIAQTLQRQINTDPAMQSVQEVNDMQNLGYTYHDSRGNSIVYDGLGGWIVNKNDKSKSQDWVIRQIHKDKASQDIGRSIALDNVNVNGRLVRPERYANQIQIASIMIANDANKDGDLIDALKLIYGNKIDYTDPTAIASAIFKMKGTESRVSQEYEEAIANPAVFEKFNDVFEIEKMLLNVGNRYIHQ